MEILWAPWRGKYIRMSLAKQECIFCYHDGKKIIDINPSISNLILYKSSTSFIIMNKYPYINGHLMVVPYRHTSDILVLNEEEKLDIFRMIQFCVKLLKEVYNPVGFNVGINIGKVAGAGIDNHIHFHVVPRFEADHNFMSTISDTRVINFSLEETYRDLYEKISKLDLEL
ncbi:MAG: HIT domain-containing protein [Candidatus Calescibacterium sp.]|nr:HIT domain-containing protein [Candidatus Calescibacterium sp.]MDW8195588.1 HIT domain-containing protein [Candidatus Calescibacterium sp.]